MPTLQQWWEALLTPREVMIESSSALIASIQAQQIRKKTSSQAKGTLAVVGRFAPTFTDSIVPIDLLHRLGVVTTPIIPNLTEICSTWAFISYLWAFEMPDASLKDRLRLSPAALDIDFHQKGLMSDQIGVGMAALIMDKYFNAPDAADVSVVAKNQVLPVELAQAASPDYLFSNAARSEYYVVECKGTRCSRHVALNQLRRGTEQVPSLRFTDRRQPPTALVIATRLTGRQTEVLIIDPPSDEEEPRDLTLPASEEWAIRDSQEFRRVVGIASELKMLGYAAADQVVHDIATLELPRFTEAWLTTPREPVPHVNDFGEFLGVEQTLRFADHVRVRVFRGIARDVLHGLQKRDYEAVKSARADLHARIRELFPDQGQHCGHQETETTTGPLALSVSPDGTILELRLESG